MQALILLGKADQRAGTLDLGGEAGKVFPLNRMVAAGAVIRM